MSLWVPFKRNSQISSLSISNMIGGSFLFLAVRLFFHQKLLHVNINTTSGHVYMYLDLWRAKLTYVFLCL